MAETQAVSSPAEAADPFEGQTPTLAEFNEYRNSGELPERFKPAVAESAPADTQEETEETEAEEPEPEPDSEPEEQQELPPKASKRDKRIAQLLAETNELKRKLAEKDVKPAAEPSPAAPVTRAKPTAEDKNTDGSPKFGSYEDFVEELADWKAEQRIAQEKEEQKKQEAIRVTKARLDEARERYDDADEIIFPASQAIDVPSVPMVVKQVMWDSDVYIDLCYVIGSDPAELRKFVSLAETNPRAAIGKVFEYERGIHEEFAKPRDDKGQFVTPEVKKTSAPKPPSPVSGASSRAFDVSDESLSPEEWMRKRTAQLAKKT